MRIQPKQYINGLRLRNVSIGNELRRNASKKILDNGTPFPKTVGYKDIDDEFKKFVTESLDVSFNGKSIPTFTLISNQRIGEYAQTWQYLDDMNNILMNFKTIFRESNPQKGKIYSESFVIPGKIDFSVFEIPVLQENGQIAVDRYTMKQPTPIDFKYTVNLITNKYELLNEFNLKVNKAFSGLQCYIFPNEHPMSMKIDSIGDESEYNVDDRKYYSQTYKIDLRGYVLTEDDFSVEHLPSRKIIIMEGDRKSGKYNRWKDITYYIDPCKEVKDEENYIHQTVNMKATFGQCEDSLTFTSKYAISVYNIELHNVFDFIVYLNGECFKMDDISSLDIEKDDEVKITVSKNDDSKESSVVIIGYNKDVIVDKTSQKESRLDDETSVIDNVS
jgi:hypothetical protein